MAERSDSPSGATARARLLSLAAHELRSPASVVGGYLHMLANDASPGLGERQQRMVSEAQKACAHIVDLARQLSDLGALELGTAPVTREAFDLFPLLTEAADRVHEAPERDLHLRVTGKADGAPLIGDRPRLRTAFEALIHALLREQPSSCTVIVERHRVSIDGQESALVVIAPEQDVQRALNGKRGPFDDVRGGTGLSLPIARLVIERHGGRVWSPPRDGASADPDAYVSLGALVVGLPLQPST